MRITGVLLGFPFLACGLFPVFSGFAHTSLGTKITLPAFLADTMVLNGESSAVQLGLPVFVLSVCVLAVWTLCVYHAIHPLSEGFLQEWYFMTPTSWSPTFWKIHYSLCMTVFSFLLCFGFGAWMIFMLEVGDAFGDSLLCQSMDDCGPLFERKALHLQEGFLYPWPESAKEAYKTSSWMYPWTSVQQDSFGFLSHETFTSLLRK